MNMMNAAFAQRELKRGILWNITYIQELIFRLSEFPEMIIDRSIDWIMQVRRHPLLR